MTKIYVEGRDGIGWSIDKDRAVLEALITAAGFETTEHWWQADIVHNVWWNVRSRQRWLQRLCGKKILLTCSNFIDPQAREFNAGMLNKAAKVSPLWLCPSKKQQKILDEMGFDTAYQPYPVDFKLFAARQLSKAEICADLGLDYQQIAGKKVIGSFQRDSLGSDLTQAKWQKNPGLLVNLLKHQDPTKYVLLLAGPRRHYLRAQCDLHGIPYVQIGQITAADDLHLNAMAFEQMPLAYQLCDLYLVVSASEGGPKAVSEAIATKTPIMSTDVGCAADFIASDLVFQDEGEYAAYVSDFLQNGMPRKVVVENYQRLWLDVNPERQVKRLKAIYSEVLTP